MEIELRVIILRFLKINSNRVPIGLFDSIASVDVLKIQYAEVFLV